MIRIVEEEDVTVMMIMEETIEDQAMAHHVADIITNKIILTVDHLKIKDITTAIKITMDNKINTFNKNLIISKPTKIENLFHLLLNQQKL